MQASGRNNQDQGIYNNQVMERGVTGTLLKPGDMSSEALYGGFTDHEASTSDTGGSGDSLSSGSGGSQDGSPPTQKRPGGVQRVVPAWNQNQPKKPNVATPEDKERRAHQPTQKNLKGGLKTTLRRDGRSPVEDNSAMMVTNPLYRRGTSETQRPLSEEDISAGYIRFGADPNSSDEEHPTGFGDDDSVTVPMMPNDTYGDTTPTRPSAPTAPPRPSQVQASQVKFEYAHQLFQYQPTTKTAADGAESAYMTPTPIKGTSVPPEETDFGFGTAGTDATYDLVAGSQQEDMYDLASSGGVVGTDVYDMASPSTAPAQRPPVPVLNGTLLAGLNVVNPEAAVNAMLAFIKQHKGDQHLSGLLVDFTLQHFKTVSTNGSLKKYAPAARKDIRHAYLHLAGFLYAWTLGDPQLADAGQHPFQPYQVTAKAFQGIRNGELGDRLTALLKQDAPADSDNADQGLYSDEIFPSAYGTVQESYGTLEQGIGNILRTMSLPGGNQKTTSANARHFNRGVIAAAVVRERLAFHPDLTLLPSQPMAQQEAESHPLQSYGISQPQWGCIALSLQAVSKKMQTPGQFDRDAIPTKKQLLKNLTAVLVHAHQLMEAQASAQNKGTRDVHIKCDTSNPATPKVTVTVKNQSYDVTSDGIALSVSSALHGPTAIIACAPAGKQIAGLPLAAVVKDGALTNAVTEDVLERVMIEYQHVKSRPLSHWERAKQWVHENPVKATVSTLLGLGVLAGAAYAGSSSGGGNGDDKSAGPSFGGNNGGNQNRGTLAPSLAPTTGPSGFTPDQIFSTQPQTSSAWWSPSETISNDVPATLTATAEELASTAAPSTASTILQRITSMAPSMLPSAAPSENPTHAPSSQPSAMPTSAAPTAVPTNDGPLDQGLNTQQCIAKWGHPNDDNCNRMRTATSECSRTLGC